VTINAGKSKFPLVAKTPVSLVTREILQFASNIEEAIAIAKKREVFVSESIFVGSAKDKKAALIEVSPNNFGVYEVKNGNRLICSNHFQSTAYANDKKNQQHILESHSKYRYERMEELLKETSKITPEIAVDILRNREGLDEKEIGYGNEKALNQMLAHHGIVFKPEDLMVWVSSNPYQLGEFVAYDLNEIFKEDAENHQAHSISKTDLNIEADSFLKSEAYQNYERYKSLRNDIQNATISKEPVKLALFSELISLNSQFWEGYFIAGNYYLDKGYDTLALGAFLEAETKEITTLPDRKILEKHIKQLKRRLR
jgi:hypothetical protein